MRASHNQNQSLRSIYGQAELAKFQSSLYVGDRRNQKNAGRDFERGIHPHEICLGPRAPGRKRLGFRAIEITHVVREGIHSFVKPLGKRTSKSTEQLCWSVDFDLGIDLQQMVQAACMISVTMRNHDKVQIVQINIHGMSIGGKDSGVIAGIKQNLLARVLDQHRESPIFLEVPRIPESIVKDSCPARGASRGGTTNGQEQATEQAKPVHRPMHVSSPLASWFVTKIELQCWLHKWHSAADRIGRTLPQSLE